MKKLIQLQILWAIIIGVSTQTCQPPTTPPICTCTWETSPGVTSTVQMTTAGSTVGPTTGYPYVPPETEASTSTAGPTPAIVKRIDLPVDLPLIFL
ncbi:unnamed protein product [Meloidogyne enterolobii]|uniref:Uncharacterized protein n=1 Tax=Meloidogyne enterolobii TaxID=390850 RepID=A0ACB1A3L2_MELEN